MQRCQSGLMCTLGKRVWSKATSGSNPDLCAKAKNCTLVSEPRFARFLKRIRLFFALRDQTQLALRWRVGRVLTSFFELKISSIFLFKAPDENAKAFCAYSLAKKAAASHEVEDYMRAEEALSVRKLKISSIFLIKAPDENAKGILRLLSCEENCSKKSG